MTDKCTSSKFVSVCVEQILCNILDDPIALIEMADCNVEDVVDVIWRILRNASEVSG